MHILLRLSMQLAMLLMLLTVYILLAVLFTKDCHYYDESKINMLLNAQKINIDAC